MEACAWLLSSARIDTFQLRSITNVKSMSSYTDRVTARRQRPSLADALLPVILLAAVAVGVVAFRAWAFMPVGQF